MVEPDGIHLWTWDARPYPAFPAATDVWSDGANWETGHWLTGRLGSAPLDALVSAILARRRRNRRRLSVSWARGLTAMWSTGRCRRARCSSRWRSPLRSMPASRTARCVSASAAARRWLILTEDDLVLPDEGPPARLTRAQETELPREVSIGFTDVGTDYQRGAAASRRLVGGDAQRACRPRRRHQRQRGRTARRNLAAGSVGRPRKRGVCAAAEPACARARRCGGLTVNGRRRLFEVQKSSTPKTERSRRDRSIRRCSISRSSPPRRRTVACRRDRPGACSWCSICRR